MDAYLLQLVSELQQAVAGPVSFVVDETRGPIDTRGRPKISLTPDSLARLGLYAAFERPGWRCGDYGLYLAREAYPDVDYYWMIEHDVSLRFHNLADFFARFSRETADFICGELGPADRSWYWHQSMSAHYPQVYKCLFAVTRTSGRALDYMVARRRQLGQAHASIAEGEDALWPNDEAFVATELMNNGYLCRDLNSPDDQLYTSETFCFGTPLAKSDLDSRVVDNCIYHPVLSGEHYFSKLYGAMKTDADREHVHREITRLVGKEWSAADARRYANVVDGMVFPGDDWRCRTRAWLRRVVRMTRHVRS